jgi:capsular polysaccharide export protein
VYKKINSEEKYVYYPLHYTKDAQITVKYPEAYNQYELIRNIIKNLPLTYRLIVKEHPAYIGKYSLRELYNLSKDPRIVIVNPKISSKDIFPFSEYVFSINSTVGYEALFFKNIVFVLGETFYKNLPGVIKINSEKELFSIMSNELFIKKKKEEMNNELEKEVKNLLKNSLKSDYDNFFTGKAMSSGVIAITLLLRKIAYGTAK